MFQHSVAQLLFMIEVHIYGGLITNNKVQKAIWKWLREFEKSVKIPERKQAHEVNIKSGILVGSELMYRFILKYTWLF